MPESQPEQQLSSSRPSMSPLWLAVWAAADKALPMLYGVAVVVVAMQALHTDEWGAWTIFNALFLVISMIGDFFVLQPMVKIATEGNADPRPVITSSFLVYSIFSMILALAVVLLAAPLAHLMKTPIVEGPFRMMGWIVLTNIVRSHVIRVLQITYRIVSIFFVDVIYFAGLIVLMWLGWRAGTFRSSMDLVHYNLISFTASSLLGIILAFPSLLPTMKDFRVTMRRLLSLGAHQGGTGLLTVLQQQSDVLIVSGMRGGKAAGVYGAAKTFYRFFDSVRDAAQLLLVPATSRAYSQERIEAVEEVTELATAALVALMFPLSLGLIVLAPWIVPMVLKNFPEAVDEFQWLMGTGFVMPFVIVPSAVLLGIGHTRDLFRGTLIGTAVIIIGGCILTWFLGSAGMAIGVLMGTIVTAILLTRRMNRYVTFTFRTVLRRSRSFGPLVKKRLAMLQSPLRKKS
ncbi:MAG: oligosaccharide flippase family protein [Candidatus Kapaibacterium sp.]